MNANTYFRYSLMIYKFLIMVKYVTFDVNMNFLVFLILAHLFQAVYGMPSCSKNFCHGNGQCAFQTSGSWHCSCDESYHGNQCQNKKISYAAQLNITRLSIGSISYNGSELARGLENNFSRVRQETAALTRLLFKKSFANEDTYLGGSLRVPKNQVPFYKFEFMEKSTVSLKTLGKQVSFALAHARYTVHDTRNSTSLSLQIHVASFRDYNECSETTVDACNANKFCTNTEGSFTCTCVDGYEATGDECEIASAGELNWKQIVIWGSVVLVILFWMFIAMVCAAKRRHVKRGKSLQKSIQEAQIQRKTTYDRSRRNSMDTPQSRRPSFASTVSISVDSPADSKKDQRFRSFSDTSYCQSPSLSPRMAKRGEDKNGSFRSPSPGRRSPIIPNKERRGSSLPNLLDEQNFDALRKDGSYNNWDSRSTFSLALGNIDNNKTQQDHASKLGSLPLLNEPSTSFPKGSFLYEDANSSGSHPQIVITDSTSCGPRLSNQYDNPMATSFPEPDY